MALTRLTVLYRGPLASCNYGCTYCPFAKHPESAAERADDTAALARFLGWVARLPEAEPGLGVSVFFTPWGEALHHRRYQQAITTLSRTGHVRQVAIQTNLAGSVGWLAEAELRRVGLWATYHPGQVDRARFVRRCAELDNLGARYSVGVVGVRHQVAEIEALRADLDPRIPLWVNAFSVDGGAVRPGYYDAETLARLSAVDPLFEVGTLRLRSRGRECAAGQSAISVDGDGRARRCQVLARPLGNIYRDPLARILSTTPCPAALCDCHIGYVHLADLGAEQVYGDGLLARIPEGSGWADPQAYLDRARALAAPALPQAPPGGRGPSPAACCAP